MSPQEVSSLLREKLMKGSYQNISTVIDVYRVQHLHMNLEEILCDKIGKFETFLMY